MNINIKNTRSKMLITSILQVAVLVVSCGGEYTEPEIPQIDYKLILVDSIGQESGNSNYIIGLPLDVEYFPNDYIAILDQMKSTVSVFDSTGSYVINVGSEGNGPEQFHILNGLAIFSDGSMIVSDANSVNIFDSTYSVIETISTTHTERVISGFGNGDYFGTDLRIEMDSKEPMFVNTYGRWSRNCELLINYHDRRVPTSVLQNNGSNVIEESERMFCCASTSGVAFFSEISREEFTIYGYDPEGRLYITINDPDYHKVKRADDEIASLIQIEDSYTSAIFGSSVSSQFEYKPLPYRPSISGMFVDHEDRLWVRLGYYSIPIFRVYSLNGNVLFHVILEPELDDSDYSSWEFVESEFGIIAYNKKPREYVRIYILRLQKV